MKTPRWGKCPGCREWSLIRGDGKIWSHRFKGCHDNDLCSGSAQLPLETK